MQHQIPTTIKTNLIQQTLDKMIKVLVTYASAHGTTQSIAERIHSQISASNIGPVTISKIKENPHFGDFDVIIIGSSIHMQSWLAPATRFLKLNALFLKEQPKPTWAFSVGMPTDGAAEVEEKKMEKWLRGLIDIRGHKLFMGQWQKGDLPWGIRWVIRLCGWKEEDKRDWEAVDKWADGIVVELRTTTLTSTSRNW